MSRGRFRSGYSERTLSPTSASPVGKPDAFRGDLDLGNIEHDVSGIGVSHVARSGIGQGVTTDARHTAQTAVLVKNPANAGGPDAVLAVESLPDLNGLSPGIGGCRAAPRRIAR